MLGLRAQADPILARAHEVAQRFIVGRRNADRRELARPMQPGQGVAIPPIGLDPIAAPLRHARGIDHDAVLALAGEIAMDPEPARAGLVHEPQPSIRCAQRRDDLGYRLQIVGDHPVVAYLAVTPLRRERDVDRFLVDIHPTNMRRFAMACLRCMWLGASPSSASRNPRCTT